MTEERSPENQPAHLSDEAAHRLLARASELDQTRDSETTVRELRDAAREAGISVQAFDAALRELTASSPAVGTTRHVLPRGNILRRLWARMRGDRLEQPTVGDAVVSNAIAAAVSRVSVFLLTRITMGLGWQGMESAILLGCVLGVGIARKLHARVVELGLMGMVAFQSAELAMHLLFGIRAVQSGPTHFAVMIAGILGVVLARSASGTYGRLDVSVHDVAASASPDEESTHREHARDEPNAFVRWVRWSAPSLGAWLRHHAPAIMQASHRRVI